MSMINFPVSKSETVEVFINNTAVTQFNFKDNEMTLDKVKLFGLVIHTQAVGTTKSGKTVLADAIQKKAVLTLIGNDGKEEFKNLPVETFFNDQKNMIPLNGVVIDVRKSYFHLQDRAGVTVDMAFLVTFFYEKI